jgi:hypothetical protein
MICTSDLTVARAIVHVSRHHKLNMHKYPFEGARKHQRTSIGELQNQEREKKKKNKLPERLTVGQIALGHGGGSTTGAWHFRLFSRGDTFFLAAPVETPRSRNRRHLHRLADALPLTAASGRRRDDPVSMHLLPLYPSSPLILRGDAGWERGRRLVFGSGGALGSRPPGGGDETPPRRAARPPPDSCSQRSLELGEERRNPLH